MYDFDAPLFYFKFVFLAEILVAEALIAYRMKRRPHFAWRAAGAFVCLLLFTFALPVPFYNAIYSSALFMMIFLLTLGMDQLHKGIQFPGADPGGKFSCRLSSSEQRHV